MLRKYYSVYSDDLDAHTRRTLPEDSFNMSRSCKLGSPFGKYEPREYGSFIAPLITVHLTIPWIDCVYYAQLDHINEAYATIMAKQSSAK